MRVIVEVCVLCIFDYLSNLAAWMKDCAGSKQMSTYEGICTTFHCIPQQSTLEMAQSLSWNKNSHSISRLITIGTDPFISCGQLNLSNSCGQINEKPKVDHHSPDKTVNVNRNRGWYFQEGSCSWVKFSLSVSVLFIWPPDCFHP